MNEQDLKSIICIDDEQDILEITKLSLETVGGYNVTACNDGHAGIEKALEISPDLFLIDVMMPGIDGPATLEKIKQNDAIKNTPVIFMTARVQPAEVEEYINLGAAGVVSKPFDPMQLAGEVLKIWKNV